MELLLQKKKYIFIHWNKMKINKKSYNLKSNSVKTEISLKIKYLKMVLKLLTWLYIYIKV